MGNNITLCQPSLTRDTYFPGNQISGSVKVVATDNVEYYGIRVAILGKTYYRYESGSGKHRHTHHIYNTFSKTVLTVAGDSEEAAATQKNKYVLPAGEHNFNFAALLSPATLPSANVQSGSQIGRVFWEVVAEVDVAGRLNQAGSVGFIVFAPTSTAQWMVPSPKTIEQDFNIVCCCACCCCCCPSACDEGKTHIRASIDKSYVVLDRDKINFSIDIDNSGTKEAIEAVNALLQCVVIPKIGPTHLRPTQIFFNQRIPVRIAGGARGQAQGTINLAPGAPPTINSAVIDVKWFFIAVIEEEGCTTVNPRAPIDVDVFHTCDDTGAAQYIQQQQAAFVPILNAEQLNQRGTWEVPNMMMSQNSPAFGQVAAHPPPPPPPGQLPPWAIENNNNNNNNAYGAPPPPPSGYSYDNNNSSVPPPPPPPGAYQQFPGFAQYPDSSYFLQAQQSGNYGSPTK